MTLQPPNKAKLSLDLNNGANHRRGIFASSSSRQIPISPRQKNSTSSGSSLSALFMSDSSSGPGTLAKTKLPSVSSTSGRQSQGRSSKPNIYGRIAGSKAHELDLEKSIVMMEKGHRVCKILLLKKWEPAYKRLYFNRETRQIVLSKNDPNNPVTAKLGKPTYLDMVLIKDVQSLDYKMNRMKIHDKWKKDKELQRFQTEWIMILSFGSTFVLNHWIFLFDSSESCRMWCQGIHHLRMELMYASHFLLTERWLRKQFHTLVNTDSATVTIRHMKPFVQTTLQYKVQSKQLQEITEGEMGFEAFVLAHKRLVNLNSLFQQYFVQWAEEKEGQRVSFTNFCKFASEQGEEFARTKDDASAYLRRYFREVDISRDVPEPYFTGDEFVDFLFSRENSIFDPINYRVIHDMNQPLTNYWIASSHNTYLTGDQLKSESSLDAYSRALMMGCRCIELDCWDGQKKSNGEFAEIVIYHGYTMTSKLNLRDVLNTIKHYAFQASDYPVILSIEDNCSVPAQRLMAQEIKEILGDLLLTAPVSRDETQLPSPAALRRKIILKHKKLQLENEGLSLSGCEDEGENDILSRECTKRGILWLYDPSTKEWNRHVFVLFDDRLCYIIDNVDEDTVSIKEDNISEAGTENENEEELPPSGFGVRSEEMHVTEEWYHGRVGRDEAKKRVLSHADKGNGVYLVRESGTFIGDYTLTFLHDKLVHHCRIKTDMVKGVKKFFFLPDNRRDTLYELISFYTKHTLDTPAFRSYLITPCPQPTPHIGQPWFDETADKKRAEELLSTVKDSGSFLIRYSSTDRSVFVLSMRVDTEFWHYRLKRDGRIFVVNQTVFESLNQIVDYYSTRDFVRGICLKFPVNEETAGQYASSDGGSTAQAGWYMELKDLEKEIQTIAIKDYEGESPEELSFTVGAKISIIRKDGDVWKGRCEDEVGWFPAEFVKVVDSDANGDMNFATVELANCGAETISMDRPNAFRLSQGTSHWNMNELIVAADSKEEMEEWLSNVTTASQCVNNKISLLRTKEKQLRIANELSSLVVYCQAVPFDIDFALKDSRATFYEMCSFSETKHDRLLEKNLTLFNSRQLSRVYPQASRLTSTNFNPVPMWTSGCHLVALNYQTGDKPLQLNDAKFMGNGRCGYILKPQYLMDETFRPDLANDYPRAGAFPIVLTIHVIAGKHLSRKDHNKGICSPFVEVEIMGVPTDAIAYRTESITSNGLNPHWNETFVFQVYRPEVALLRFTVEDGDFVGPKTDPFIGQASFSLDCIRPGFRSVPLMNPFGEPFEMSALLVSVEIRPLVDSSSGTPTLPMECLEAHLKLQANRTTVGETGKKKDSNYYQQSFAEPPLLRSIPRLSFDYGYEDGPSQYVSMPSNASMQYVSMSSNASMQYVSMSHPSMSQSKSIDRKISQTQSIDSYSTVNSSPKTPNTPLSTLSTLTMDSSMESEDSSMPSSSSLATKKSGFKKFFRFGK